MSEDEFETNGTAEHNDAVRNECCLVVCVKFTQRFAFLFTNKACEAGELVYRSNLSIGANELFKIKRSIQAW